MTRLSTLLLLSCGLLGCDLAHAQPAKTSAPASARPVNALNVRVEPLTSALAGQALIELAQRADVNLLADLDEAVPFKDAGEKPTTLRSTLNRLSRANGWSWRRQSAQTFLLWKQPDALALARQIYAAPAETAPASTAPAATPLDANIAAAPVEPLNVALARFLAAHNDSPDAAQWRDVPLLELPPELRERITDSLQAQTRDGLQFAASGAVLGDEFWTKAVLKIVALPAPRPRGAARPKPGEKPDANAPKQEYLFVTGRFAHGNGGATTMLSLGRWPLAEAAPAFPEVEF